MKLYRLYQNLESSFKRVRSYFHKGHLTEKIFVDVAKEINLKLDKVEAKAKSCFDLKNQQACQNIGLESFDFSLSNLRNKVCSVMREQALKEGFVDQDSFGIGEDHNLVPFQKRGTNNELILTWGPCDELKL